MQRISEQFRDAMRAAYNAHGFTSYRHAEYRTGIHGSAFSRMLKGVVPGRGLLVRWATAIGEPVEKWLTLGGYDEGLTNSAQDDALEQAAQRLVLEQESSPKSPRREVPVISETLHAAIAAAPSREEKVRIAWEYLWLRGPELGLTGWGAADSGARTLAGRIALIRATEAALGIRLLPPDVG